MKPVKYKGSEVYATSVVKPDDSMEDDSIGGINIQHSLSLLIDTHKREIDAKNK